MIDTAAIRERVESMDGNLQQRAQHAFADRIALLAAHDRMHQEIDRLIEAVGVVLGTPGFIRGREKISTLIDAILAARADRAAISPNGEA